MISTFFPRRKKTPTALIAWEIGAGFTHSQNLWGVVRHLRYMGFRCVVATADPRFEIWFRALGTDVVQTFLWPVMRSNAAMPEQRPARVLTDVLANYGVTRPIDLKGAMAHYETLFSLVKPDVVLAENGFGIVLAARGRYPVVIFGSTLLFMPPALGHSFAPIDPSDPTASWPVEMVLDDINSALAASARMPLTCASEILDCDALVPFGPAPFDPYSRYRTSPIYSPHCPDLPREVARTTGDEVAVYLHDLAQMSVELMDVIANLASPVRIYIPTLNPALRSRFLAAGHIVEDRMMPLRLVAERARLLVHQGGVTLTAAALALGIPQVILARFHENGLAGQFVSDARLGYTNRLDAEGDWISETVMHARNDNELRNRARRRMPEFRSWFSEDPTGIVAIKAARLLGLSATVAPQLLDPHQWSPI